MMASLADLLLQVAQEAEWQRNRSLLSQGVPEGLEGVVPTAEGTALGTPFIDPIDIISGGGAGAKFGLSTGRAPLAEALRWASSGGDILYDIGRGLGRRFIPQATREAEKRMGGTISGARTPAKPRPSIESKVGGGRETMGTPREPMRRLPGGQTFEAGPSPIYHQMPESAPGTFPLVAPGAQDLTLTVKRMFEALNRPLQRPPSGLIEAGKETFGRDQVGPEVLTNAVETMVKRKGLGKTASKVLAPNKGENFTASDVAQVGGLSKEQVEKARRVFLGEVEETGENVKDVPGLRKLAGIMWKTQGKKGLKEITSLLKSGKVTKGQISHNLSNELQNLALEGGEMTSKNYEKVQSLMELLQGVF